MILRRPVAQAVQHHVAHDRVVAVQRVAGAAEVEVVALRRQHVVGLVVDALEGDVRALLVAFGRVVEDHIQDDLDAVAMQLLHQRLELVHLHAELAGRRVTGLGRKEADRAVAPVVEKLLAGVGVDLAVFPLVELVDRHQLEAVDAQLLQIADLLPDAREGARKFDAGRRMPGEAAHVHLVDHQVFHRGFQRVVLLPVEVIVDQPAAVLVRRRSSSAAPPTHPGRRWRGHRDRAGSWRRRSGALPAR